MPLYADNMKLTASNEVDQVSWIADSSVAAVQLAQEAWSKGVSEAKEHPVLTAGAAIAAGLAIHNKDVIANSGKALATTGTVIAAGLVIHDRNNIANTSKALATEFLCGPEKEASSTGSNVSSQRYPEAKITFHSTANAQIDVLPALTSDRSSRFILDRAPVSKTTLEGQTFHSLNRNKFAPVDRLCHNIDTESGL